MKSFCQVFLLVFCVLVLAAVPVLTAFSDAGDYSLYENRTLASRPAFSLSALLSGDYFEGWENYLRDRVWQRDTLLALDARLETAAGRLFVNDVLTADEALLPYVEGIDPDTVREDAARMADQLAAIAAQVESYGGVFLYVGVPNQYSVFRDGYPDYMDYIAEGLDAALDALLSGEVDAAVFTTFDKAFADILVEAIVDQQICQCDYDIVNPEIKGVGFILMKGNTDLRDYINEHLAQYRSSGLLQQLNDTSESEAKAMGII